MKRISMRWVSVIAMEHLRCLNVVVGKSGSVPVLRPFMQYSDAVELTFGQLSRSTATDLVLSVVPADTKERTWSVEGIWCPQ